MKIKKRKFYIPPALMLYSVIGMVGFYFLIPGYNAFPKPYNWMGFIVSVAGFMLMGKVREAFREHGNPVEIRQPNKLITDGAFSWSRNPMYLGMLLMLCGFTIVSANLLNWVFPVMFIAIVRKIFISQEEVLLLATFGDDYRDYAKRVRRWI